MNAPNCPDCKMSMEEGYALELGHYNAPAVSCWYPGLPKWVSGFLGTRLDYLPGRRLAIESFRCPQCGLLREYAREKPRV